MVESAPRVSSAPSIPSRSPPPLPHRLIPHSFSSLAAHRSFMLPPRLCSVWPCSKPCRIYAKQMQGRSRVSLLPHALARLRACVRADVRAREYRTGSVRERAMTWSRSWQKLSAFRRKARLLDRDKTRPWGVARYRVRVADDLVEFRFVWFEDRVGRGPNCHRASENGSIWNFRAHASLQWRERFLGRVEPLNVKKRFVLNQQFKFGKFPR